MSVLNNICAEVMAQTEAVAPDVLCDTLRTVLGGHSCDVTVALEEVTVEVSAKDYLSVMQTLLEDRHCRFDQLVDLCGVDYSTYKDVGLDGPRFAVVVHLLSVALNQRLRVKVFCEDDAFPVLPSVTGIWSAANWFEREAFDLYGIVFEGHDDLRRILTDYGFVGHPFRKDFPLSGFTEMSYDPEQARVLYQPVSIEPREITPRIIREAEYGGLH